MSRALVVLLVLAAACRRTQEPDAVNAVPPVAAATAPASAEPAPAAAAPAPGAAAQPAELPSGFEAQAGGRTLAWWGERLTVLRRDGPGELYQLALQRAKANGLVVNVDGERITVRSGEAGGTP